MNMCSTTSRSNKNDAISTLVDQMFDSAFNTSQIEGDLPNVRWGRIDYFNVTYLTTKWGVWQCVSCRSSPLTDSSCNSLRAPTLVIAKDRGQTLRFYRPQHIRVREDAFRAFLQTEGYQSTPPWSTIWAPGGDR